MENLELHIKTRLGEIEQVIKLKRILAKYETDQMLRNSTARDLKHLRADRRIYSIIIKRFM